MLPNIFFINHHCKPSHNLLKYSKKPNLLNFLQGVFEKKCKIITSNRLHFISGTFQCVFIRKDQNIGHTHTCCLSNTILTQNGRASVSNRERNKFIHAEPRNRCVLRFQQINANPHKHQCILVSR